MLQVNWNYAASELELCKYCQLQHLVLKGLTACKLQAVVVTPQPGYSHAWLTPEQSFPKTPPPGLRCSWFGHPCKRFGWHW